MAGGPGRSRHGNRRRNRLAGRRGYRYASKTRIRYSFDKVRQLGRIGQSIPANRSVQLFQSIHAAISSAISRTFIESSFSSCLTPSVNIVLQKGEAAAIIPAPVDRASAVRSKLTRV